MHSRIVSRVFRQAGLTLVEMMVSIAISMTVLSGVVQVLVVSKSNFITGRELSGLQENARFAVKFLTDQVRMAGYTGCSHTPLKFSNVVTGNSGSSVSWYLSKPGLQGFEYDAGISSFPTQFRSDVAANTDAIVVRKGEPTGLRLNGNAVTGSSAKMTMTKVHSYQRGQLFLVVYPTCEQLSMFQMSGPANTSNNANTVEYKTGVVSPGNCTNSLGGNYACSGSGSSTFAFVKGSTLLEMHSDAYYIGVSATDSTTPALYRERLVLNSSTMALTTSAEELVQGVENMQVQYGLDTTDDGIANRYIKANNAAMNWANVVSVRIALRMRSLSPVYNENVAYAAFEGISGTNGSDRYMRQSVYTTVMLRNF